MAKCPVTYMTKCMDIIIQIVNNRNQTQNCKYQKTIANCGNNFQNIVVSSITCCFHLIHDLAQGVVFTIQVGIS